MKIQCPICNAILNVPERLAGESGKCPKCHNSISIPADKTSKQAIPVLEESYHSTPQANSNVGKPKKLFDDKKQMYGCIWNWIVVLLIATFFGFVIKSGCNDANRKHKENQEENEKNAKVRKQQIESACNSLKAYIDDGIITNLDLDNGTIHVNSLKWMYMNAQAKEMLTTQAFVCSGGIMPVEIRDSQSGRTLSKMTIDSVKFY
jgi:hypothetical protein